MEKRIVITGIGIISSIGSDKESFWNNLVSGISGIKPITLFDASSFKSNLAGEISDFEPKSYLGKKGIRHIDRTSLLTCSATKLAMQDADIKEQTYSSDELGIVIGSTYGSIDSISEFDLEALKEGPSYVNPMAFPNTVLNAPAARASIFCHSTGLNTTVSTGVTSGIDAIIYASDFLKMDKIKAVLAGGVFGLTYGIYLGAYRSGLMAGSKDNAIEISAPFDKRRNGFVLGEGAAVLMLESIEDAEKRKAKIYGEIKGYGTAFNPGKVRADASSKEGCERSIELAIKDASISKDEISYISACANSSVTGDKRETAIIKNAFGNKSSKIPISAIKSMIGECLDASSAIQTVSSLMALNNNIVPPTINYKEPADECDLDYVSNSSREIDVKNVLINSFSDTGNASSLILSRC